MRFSRMRFSRMRFSRMGFSCMGLSTSLLEVPIDYTCLGSCYSIGGQYASTSSSHFRFPPCHSPHDRPSNAPLGAGNLYTLTTLLRLDTAALTLLFTPSTLSFSLCNPISPTHRPTPRISKRPFNLYLPQPSIVQQQICLAFTLSPTLHEISIRSKSSS